MKIQKIYAHRIAIPFKKPFRHATSVRTQTDNVIVETILEDGTHGYGEGLPREYVTGETVEDVLESLRDLDPDIFKTDIGTLEGLVAHLNEVVLSQIYFKKDRQNNTARCALELSLLDAFCRSFNKRFRDVALLVWPALADTREKSFVFYDGVLSLESTKRVMWNALKIRLYGFRQLKLKVDADDAATLQLTKLVRRLVGTKKDLRLDSNEAWNAEQTLRMAHKLAPLGISCLEQPLPHCDLMQMREVTAASPIPTMLDESLCTLGDAEFAIEHRLCKLFNIRISKCGGFINSLRIAQLAEQSGIGYQLGCLVGETALLSAAGRQMATLLPSMRYLEGSYDKHLLRANVSTQDITFSYGGKAPALDGAGLGLVVDSPEQNQYTTRTIPLYEIT